MRSVFKKLSLGIELGSTRIKSVLIDENREVVARGSYQWENQLVDSGWTYDLEEVWQGIQASYQELKTEVLDKHGFILRQLDAIGVSAMMHGYLAFDKEGQLLVPFRTWRNATTEEAEQKLRELFRFNIPQRWSVAHFYQAILNEESHVKDVNFLTTLAGYVHWQLTGEKVLGIGDASGMFPVDSKTFGYDSGMMALFEDRIAPLAPLLPTIKVAGEVAGTLTSQGAVLLDSSGDLEAGVPLCPPEGDAGTGMVATNSVAKGTGNVSAGTSIFAMVVLEEALKGVYPEVDVVATPSGDAVAMIHANNCSSDVNAWVGIFRDFALATGMMLNEDELYGTLFREALKGDLDAGGLLSYGYLSGENITQVPEGRPMLVRGPKSNFNLANLMRSHLYTALGALKIGMNLLVNEEDVNITKIVGHGGIFKSEGVFQRFLAAALDTTVQVLETADMGGAWGVALLADYLGFEGSLDGYLEEVFSAEKSESYRPTIEEVAGFEQFSKRYQSGLEVQLAAGRHLA